MIMSRSVQLVTSAFSFLMKSGTLTILCHNREHASSTREPILPKSKIDSWALMILVTIVSKHLQLVTPCSFEIQRLVYLSHDREQQYHNREQAVCRIFGKY